jgi:hypothetical protein
MRPLILSNTQVLLLSCKDHYYALYLDLYLDLNKEPSDENHVHH